MEQVALALKLDAGSLRFDIRPHDLGALVREAAQEAETRRSPARGRHGRGPRGAGRPDPRHRTHSPADRQRDDVLAAGAPIEVHLRREGHDALIEVIDRGPGIPPDEREAVFERFADWRPPGYEDRPGRGLGLFISRAIARAHGGDASIADGPDGGTMLIVRLPAGGTNGGRCVTTLLICDDHKVLTDALATVVGLDDDLQLIAPPVHDPETAIELSAQHLPDVVLMDIVFKGGMSGIEATRRIKEISPATKVVIITAHDEDRLLVEAVEAGASGFLGKGEAVEEVLAAAKAAAEGEVLIDPATLTRLLAQVAREREAHREATTLLDDLTDREREILQLLAEGMRNEGIATKLFISPQTVQTHVRNILGKLRVHSKLEAVAFAVKHGAITV